MKRRKLGILSKIFGEKNAKKILNTRIRANKEKKVMSPSEILVNLRVGLGAVVLPQKAHQKVGRRQRNARLMIPVSIKQNKEASTKTPCKRNYRNNCKQSSKAPVS